MQQFIWRFDHGPGFTREELLEERRFFEPLAVDDKVGYTKHGVALIDAKIHSLDTGEPYVEPIGPPSPEPEKFGIANGCGIALVVVPILAIIVTVVVFLVRSVASGPASGDSADSEGDNLMGDYIGSPTTGDGGISTDEHFLTVLRASVPSFNTVPDAEIIGTAHNLCSFLEGGGSGSETASIALNSGMTATQAGAFVGAATAAYCPAYESTVQDYGG
jgi:hypothetical protein